MAKKLHIKKGDTVMVIAGEAKGYQGRVLEVFPGKNKAIVEGANEISRHSKPDSNNTEGGIIKKEAPIHLSNLMVVDPKEGKPNRIGRKMSDGKNIRYSKKTGEEIK